MERETAEIVLYALTAALCLVWVSGLAFLLRTSGSARASDRPHEADLLEPMGAGWIAGELEVEGEPSALAAAAARALASASVAGPETLRILSATEGGVVWEATGVQGARWPGLKKAGLRFSPGAAPGRARAAYAVRPCSRGFLAIAWTLQLLGLLAIAGGFVLIRTLVVSSDEPAVRWQVFQILQAAHFLWPPFLFAGIYRSGRRTLRKRIETFIANLARVGG